MRFPGSSVEADEIKRRLVTMAVFSHLFFFSCVESGAVDRILGLIRNVLLGDYDRTWDNGVFIVTGHGI